MEVLVILTGIMTPVTKLSPVILVEMKSSQESTEIFFPVIIIKIMVDLFYFQRSLWDVPPPPSPVIFVIMAKNAYTFPTKQTW